jgi:PAS domain S-box-containing protein
MSEKFQPGTPFSDDECYRLLVNAISDCAIYMLDPNGLVTSWNPGAERFKGYAAEEVLGSHFSRFYTREDREAGSPAHGLAIAAAQGRWEADGVRLRKDGSRFWAHVVIDAIKDEGGTLIGFAKVTRDITERVEAQRALDQARETLFQSQKLEAIGQLTGGIAHDFNNLLSAVLGGLEIARKRMAYDPQVTPLLDNAFEAANRGAALTQHMLAFARKQELHLEAVDLASLVGGWRTFLERAIGPGIGVVARLPENLPMAFVDPHQLENGLLNIALNARDAMANGGTITISARTGQPDDPSLSLTAGEYVCLTVTDTGEGMDETVLAQATNPFFTTKGVGKGTGLGLSMVHGLMAQSGGAIRLRSQRRRGTTVELWFQARDRNEALSRTETPPPEARAEDTKYLILAVDDDGLVLLNTVTMLEDIGHEVIEASSGAEALVIFDDVPDIDLLITDQAMPGMTGAELAAKLRAKRPDLPVLIATGYANLDLTADAQLPRLAKPFTQRSLAQAARAAVAAAQTLVPN